MESFSSDMPASDTEKDAAAVLWCEDVDGNPATVPVTDMAHWINSSKQTWFEWLSRCVAGVDSSAYPPSEESDALALNLERLNKMKYVVMLRTDLLEPPRVNDKNSFESGLWRGRALLFRVEDGALLGGRILSASNSTRVKSVVSHGSDKADDTALWMDLMSEISEAIRNEVDQVFHGAKPSGR